MAVRLDILAIERDHTQLPVEQIAGWLSEHLGQRLTAYIAGIKDAKLVGKWAASAHVPNPDSETRLRRAYFAARLIATAYDDRTAQAWFFGTCSSLDDHAPASVLRHASDPDEMYGVVPAARAFAVGNG